MAATLFFDGYPEPPRSRGATPANAPVLADGPELTSSVAAGVSTQAHGRRRSGPPLALAISLTGLVTGQAAGFPWLNALGLVVLVAGLTMVYATVSGAAFGLAPPVVVPGGRSTQPLLESTPARRPRRPRYVYVVGDEEFCRRVSVAAGKRRVVAGRWHFDGTTEGTPFQYLLDELSQMDELVIEGSCFNAFAEAGWIPQCKGRARVVPAGAQAETAFADPFGPGARLLKRTLDLALALGALLLVAPCLLLAMLAVRLDSPGPALFRQVRVGEGGRRFTLYKLRTMTTGEEDPAVLAYMADMVRCQAEPENGLFKLGSNRRITRVGRWLRRLSIDEVPQLLNVLKGDMSVVGPRPPILEEAACYNEFHWQRLAVRPGITGLAQVNGRSRLRFDDIVALDVRYSRSWSLLLELKIILRTPAAVVSGRGAT